MQEIVEIDKQLKLINEVAKICCSSSFTSSSFSMCVRGFNASEQDKSKEPQSIRSAIEDLRSIIESAKEKKLNSSPDVSISKNEKTINVELSDVSALGVLEFIKLDLEKKKKTYEIMLQNVT